MGNLWSFLKRKKEAESAEMSTPEAASTVAPSANEATQSPPADVAVVEAPAAEPAKRTAPPLPEIHDLAALALAEEIRGAMRSALTQQAHALLLDPEEFCCMLCLIGNGAIEQIGECPLGAYELAHRTIEMLDHGHIRDGDVEMYVQLYNTVTDLGRRVIVQFFPAEWDDEMRTERRKATVRLINRLRSGTSLSRHNRETLLGILRRERSRPGPSFLQLLEKEGLLPKEMTLDGQASPDDVLRSIPLPRKAVTRVLGAYLDIPYVDVEGDIPHDHARLFEKEQILSWEAIPIGVEDDDVIVAMADPTNVEAVARMRDHLGRPVVVRVAAAIDIRVAVDKIFRER